MSSARHLVIVRHAKANQAGPSDYERPLLDRGHGDARAVGRWLGGQGTAPDLALVSAALRTQETWRGVAAAAGWDLAPTLDRGLYAAGPDTALDLLRAQADEASTVVMIGHNPTMAYLAQLLGDGEADPALMAELIQGFPTSATAVFDYDGAWADLDFGSARLVGFHVGRGDTPGQ